MDASRTGLAGLAFMALSNHASAFVPGASIQGLDNTAVGLRGASGSSAEQMEVPVVNAQEDYSDGSNGSVVPSLTVGLAVGGMALAKLSQRHRSAVSSRSRSAVVCHAFENELGVQAPIGFWDPLGFCKDGDEAKFKRRRASELKHGRWCMLATVGYIVPEYIRIPGFLSTSQNLKFADMPNGLQAMSKIPLGGGMQIFVALALLECTLYQQDGSRAPGDFENVGNLGVPFSEGIPDPEKRKRGLNSELANGRLAMIAIMGMMFQDGTFGTTGPEMWLPASAFEGELGVQPPFGYWDPLGLSKEGDADVFYRRRCTEIKHGRVSMWATLGYIVPEYFRWPGYLSPSAGLKFTDVPNGLAAFSKVSGSGWAQIFLFCGFMELANAKQDPANPPGMLTGYDGPWGKGVEFGRLGIFRGDRIADPEKKKRALNSEIANGRLAMMAIIGMFFQDGLTGSAWGDWALYTASPLRAFENELGVQAPVGFWDPLGFCKDGDEAKFRRRRASELKHGRWCMLATVGYIVPEYIRIPGFLSTSQNLKFADMPNGLQAMSKIPLGGGMQIFVALALLECTLYQQDGSRGPGDFENVGNLGVPFAEGIPDPEKRKRGLNSELANGRLAMIAIMGMMFQDGTFGTTGPEMWLPASAFEGELGVQPPFGYWDPLGLGKDGDADVFYRRRCTEIKHGRVSMWATLGYIVPEYARWPGYLSPSANIKFTDVPNGLAAFSKVSGAGWAQIFLFCGFMELANAKQDPANPPGMLTGYDGPFGKGVEFGRLGIFRGDRIADPEAKKRALNAEIANGRLAMMAIIGMFFQDGLTGSAWGDWATYTDSPLRAVERTNA